MNLNDVKNQTEEILGKLMCSLCFQSLDAVYRTESGKFQCESCAGKNETHPAFDEFWTNVNAMFKELRLCLTNGEHFSDGRTVLPSNGNTPLPKRRKIVKKTPVSQSTNDVIEFFTNGAGVNFFTARIASCLSVSSETALQPEEPANKEEQSVSREEAEPSFAEEKNSLVQDNSQSNSKEMLAENFAAVEETVNGISSDHQPAIQTAQNSMVCSNEPQLKKQTPLMVCSDLPADVSENDSDTDLFVPPTPDTKLRQSKTSFMGTALSSQSKVTLQKFARFFSVTVVDSLTHEFDCLFVETATVTWKYLYARCKKIPIVRFEWVVDSLNEERFLPLGPYKIDEKELKIPAFFQSLNLILCPPFSTYSSSDVKAVLEATGAKVCNFDEWQPGLKELKTPRLLVGANDTIPYDDLTLTRMVAKYRAPIVDISYFVPVLQSGKLKNIENHLIVEMAKDDLIYLGFPERLIIQTDSDVDND